LNHKNLNTHLTAKERETISFPAKYLMRKGLINGEVLDFGCGLGKDVEVLKEKGFQVEGYDPHYFPKYPSKKYDTVLCIYVLNVLLPKEQSQVMMNISELLKPTGTAYFVVRRDIQYEGFRMHKVHKKFTYQCSVKLPFKSVFLNESCQIYAYQHYTTLHKRDLQVSPFFSEFGPEEIIVESATAFSFFDNFPVSNGHALVVPKRVVSDYFELTLKEQTAIWIMVNKVKQIIQNRYRPAGFNVGINIGKTGGQTIPHVHVHIIPRYENDVPDPRGGIRHVIPEKGNYLK
jgi:diadenosine tetraphosphate (Ap4A) HIT family hydrolase